MSGLVGHWPLHEQSGRANDLSGNGNHGTVNGATQGVAGVGGLTSYYFPSGSNNVNLGNNLNVANIGAGDKLVASFWIKTNGQEDGAILHQGTSDYSFYITTTQAKVWQAGGANHADVGISGLEDGQWHHVYVEFIDNEGGAVYIDGSLHNSSSTTDGTWNKDSTDNIYIGERPDQSHTFVGCIADVRLYNRTLSEAEIQTLYKWGSGDYARPPSDGISRYTLDGDATDSWGSNDGTNNGVTFVSDSIRGQSGEFNNSESDYIDITGISSLSAFTVSFWAKADGWPDSSQHFAVELKENNFLQIEAQSDGSQFRALINDGSTSYIASLQDPVLGVWNYYTVTWDGSTLTAYKNGTVNDVTENTDMISSSYSGDMIGSRYDAPNRLWEGNIDDVRIYDYALSPHQVYELYRWGTLGRDMRAQLVKQ